VSTTFGSLLVSSTAGTWQLKDHTGAVLTEAKSPPVFNADDYIGSITMATTGSKKGISATGKRSVAPAAARQSQSVCHQMTMCWPTCSCTDVLSLLCLGSSELASTSFNRSDVYIRITNSITHTHTHTHAHTHTHTHSLTHPPTPHTACPRARQPVPDER
jgi:hypothetical protein